ncbi:hypothetical protein L218DRAFT_920302 [Marasmius fiardii PR-910]|nr:hypothetical protein L218DRAFT_920302 [Marasmius fiardii PR-910]
MGGNAFTFLPQDAFPRLPPGLYRTLKAHLTTLLQDFYAHVAVPREAPEKEDHGDIDFVVCTPKSGLAVVPHIDIQKALGATHVIPMEGNRTSNFAVPIIAQREELLSGKVDVEGDSVYCQVDVHVCENMNEWESVCFFHSYGDMGMILGICAMNVGLHWGVHGLRVGLDLYPHPPHRPIVLSTDHHEILNFFGLSFDRWSSGFLTKEEVFQWVASSRLFDPHRFKSAGMKVKQVRNMYYEFIQWVRDITADSLPISQMSLDIDKDPGSETSDRRERVREEALVHFDKKSELEEFLRQVRNKETIKRVFNGRTVNDWIQAEERWKRVKVVMDNVREKYGGESGLIGIIEVEGEEGVKRRVIQASKAVD